jgi:hypothetical protein
MITFSLKKYGFYFITTFIYSISYIIIYLFKFYDKDFNIENQFDKSYDFENKLKISFVLFFNVSLLYNYYLVEKDKLYLEKKDESVANKGK